MKKDKEEVTTICAKCGASVYKQHLESGIARYEAGRLLCAYCVAEYERAHDASAGGITEEAFESISLEGDDDDPRIDLSESRIHAASAATLGMGGIWDDSRFKRALIRDRPVATRCRTFHAKLSDAALGFMSNQINEWLDANDEITIKFASSTIGLFEGKHVDPNLILTLFY